MTDARDEVRQLVGATVFDRLSRFTDAVLAENTQQNLISAASTGSIWQRHVLDSLQLLNLSRRDGAWIDIGTGGGFPGMVIAIATEGAMPVHLVEPRRRRAEFLQRVADHLRLTDTHVHCTRIERLTKLRGATISARAVASVEKLLLAAGHCSTPETRWLLPRGRIAPDELERLRQSLKGMFHVEHSVTDPESIILVLTGVI